jgi:hypothetical protein
MEKKLKKAIEGQKVSFKELSGFFNVSTSSLEKIASNFGFSPMEIHKIAEEMNPEVFLTLDEDAPAFTSKNFQAYFVDNDFIYNNMKIMKEGFFM